MKLNISRNTMIANDFGSQVLIRSIKKKHPDALLVDVDLLESFQIDSMHEEDPTKFLKFLVHYTIKTELGWDSVEFMPKELFVFSNESYGRKWTFDFIIFNIKNWEPFYWKYPDGIIEKISMLSYFLDYGYAKTLSAIFSGSGGLMIDKTVEFDELCAKWRGNISVILSQTKN